METYASFVKRGREIALLNDRQGQGVEYFNAHALRLYETYRVCRRFLKSGQSVLSLGAGMAYVETILARELELLIAAGDFPEALAAYEEHYSGNGIIPVPVDITSVQINVPVNPVDAIFLFEIVEHIPVAPSVLIARIARFLKPGGYLVVSTPNLATLRNMVKLLLQKPLLAPAEQTFLPVAFENEAYHKREYVPGEIQHAMEINSITAQSPVFTWYRKCRNVADTLFVLPEMAVARFRPMMIVAGRTRVS